jgi:hypothetical protein
MSRDVVKKYLKILASPTDHNNRLSNSPSSLGPGDTDNFVLMTGIGTVKHKRRKLPD